MKFKSTSLNISLWIIITAMFSFLEKRKMIYNTDINITGKKINLKRIMKTLSDGILVKYNG